MSTNIQLLVNNVDLTKYVEQDTWSVEQNWSRQGTTAHFDLIDEHADQPISLSYVITPLAVIKLLDRTLNQTLFAGVVHTPVASFQGPNLAHWQLDCRDWTYLADMVVVTGDFVAQTADGIIRQLTNNAAIGIQPFDIHSGPLLPRAKIPYMNLTQAWTRVSHLASGHGAMYGWNVDENLILHWYSHSQKGASGWVFSDNASETGASIGHYQRNFDYRWDGTSIRNRVTVRGATFSQKQTDQFVGNGSQSSWPLTYVPNTASLAATLTVGGTAKALSVDTGASVPSSQYILSQALSGQWFLRVGTDPVPGSGVIVSLTYNYQAPIIAQVNDTASQRQFVSLPNRGVFQMYLADSGIRDLTAARQRGRRELQEYALPQERVDFTTTEDFAGHITAGSIIRWKSQFIPDSQNSFKPGLDAYFFVLQNHIQGRPGNYRTYKIHAVRVMGGFSSVVQTAQYGVAVLGSASYS